MGKNSTNNLVKTLEKFYLDKKFADGIQFLKEHRSELSLATYDYFLGGFYLKSGELALGKYHLLSAAKNGFWQSDVQHNLVVADQQLNLVRVQNSYSVKDKLIFQAVSIAPDWYLLVALVLLLAVSVAYWRGVIRQIKYLLLALAVAFVPLGVKWGVVDKLHPAVVVQNSEIREGPSKAYDSSGKIPLGLTVLVEREYNGNIYIAAPEAFIGWVTKDSLKKIE